MVIPFARQAAKASAEAAKAAAAQAAKSPVRPAALKASASQPAAAAPSGQDGPNLRDFVSRAFEKQEDEFDEKPPKNVEPPSAFMAFQALGIATAIVLGSTGLGVWGAAKYMGVNSVSTRSTCSEPRQMGTELWSSPASPLSMVSTKLDRHEPLPAGANLSSRYLANTQMEGFVARMRGTLEDTFPEFVESVRRESDEPTPDAPDVMDKWGMDIDDHKLRTWVKSLGHGDESK